MKLAIYPGSFDPITNGHLDIVERASNLFDKVVIAVLINPKKKYLFTVDERVYLIKESVKKYKNVEVDSFSGLLTDYAKLKKANTIIKGLRAFSDFENEFQMALMNKKMAPDIETIFMMTNSEYSYVSSSMVKEVAAFNGNVDCMVPSIVKDYIYEKIKNKAPINKIIEKDYNYYLDDIHEELGIMIANRRK